MKDIIKKVFIVLLNPVSPIMTLIVGFLLSMLIAAPNDKLPSVINVLIKNPIIIAGYLFVWLVMAILYTILDSRLKNKNQTIEEQLRVIEEKNVELREKDNQLKHTSGIILNRSGDFAEFNRLLRFNEVLKEFTEHHMIVECAQMYTYSTKRVDNSVVIKVEYDCSYCSDGIDINNLSQCYYDIDYNDFHTIKDIISVWKKLSSEHMAFSEMDSLIELLVNKINTLYRKYYQDLRSLNSISEVTSFHFTQYRIITLLLRIARRQSTTMFDKNKILGNDKKDIEDYLLNGKRTGILNSILLEDIFMFKYTRNSHKKDGRAYVAFPLRISMKNYICVFSIQILDLDPNIDLEYEIKSLRKDIVARFEKK